MKKLGKRVLIVLVIGLILVGSYFVFYLPSGFVDQEALVTSFITNIDNANVCEEHFNEESAEYCASFVALTSSHELVIKDMSSTGSVTNLTLTIDGVDGEFEVTFIKVDVTGVKSFFNKTYYLIDFII